MLFLQELGVEGSQAITGVLMGMIAAFFLVFMIIIVALYVYMGLAYSKIAKKANYSSPGLAWIPGIGPLIITQQISKMHWWPFLLFIAMFIPIINLIALITILVYSIIWMWKTYETIGRPGWWAIAPVIPAIGTVLSLIFLGMAAWGEDK